jgi:signal transduction histidine kinase
VLNTPFTISLMSSVGGLVVGLLALRVSRARGWAELRWFAVISFCSAGYALTNLSATLEGPTAVLVAASQLQLAFGAVMYWAWLRYARAFARTEPSPVGRWIERIVLALAVLALVPGLAMTGVIVHHDFPPWRVVYHDALIGPGGWVMMAAAVPAIPAVFLRFARAHRAGVRMAGVQAAAFASVVVFSVNDAFAGTGAFPLPYLLDIGFLFPVALLVWSSTLRFLEASLALDALRDRLETMVDTRTRELAAAQDALVRAERLASLGQLANGVAHQVSNPASVVTANLRWLAESLAAEREAREVAEDALTAMQRINDLVRRLADAGRIAGTPRPNATVELHAVVERAVAEARPRLPAHVKLDTAVPEGLAVRARPEVLEQVLQSLLTNAAEALPEGRPGRIDVRAERSGRAIRLTIEDDGVGMAREVLARAFEPFFTTKPAGQGSGLGLPLSRGIVEAHGGALSLESTPARGTRAVLELPEETMLPTPSPVAKG